MDSILIIAGESSGEKYGADLVHQFKKINPSAQFIGIGGKQMVKEGVQILYSVNDLAVVGGIEIISQLPHIWKIMNGLKKKIKEKKPLAAVLIDSPDFNLRLAKTLKKLSIPVLYYISPTVWAWRKSRLKSIKKTVSQMMLIFPFEEEIYHEHNIPAVYIGHPLQEKIRVSLSPKEFYQKYGLDSHEKLITILPGSRKSEIKYHMPILIKAAEKIRNKYHAQFIALAAENLDVDFLTSFIPSSFLANITILTEDSYNAMAFSDIVLSACGTANLEAALLGTPVISFYRLSPLSYFFGVKFIKIKNYSIVNILSGKKIIPELIQRNFTPENIFLETKNILESKKIRSEMVAQLKTIRNILGAKIASQNAAQELEKLISNR